MNYLWWIERRTKQICSWVETRGDWEQLEHSQTISEQEVRSRLSTLREFQKSFTCAENGILHEFRLCRVPYEILE